MLLPGYLFWVEQTDGAKLKFPVQEEIFAYYLDKQHATQEFIL